MAVVFRGKFKVPMSDFWQGFALGLMVIPLGMVIVAFYTDMWCGITHRPLIFGWFD